MSTMSYVRKHSFDSICSDPYRVPGGGAASPGAGLITGLLAVRHGVETVRTSNITTPRHETRIHAHKHIHNTHARSFISSSIPASGSPPTALSADRMRDTIGADCWGVAGLSSDSSSDSSSFCHRAQAHIHTHGRTQIINTTINSANGTPLMSGITVTLTSSMRACSTLVRVLDRENMTDAAGGSGAVPALEGSEPDRRLGEAPVVR